MKQNKVKSIAIASVATLAVTGALALAWFVTQEDGGGINVGAGTISLNTDQINTVGSVDNILPGETLKMQAGAGITNDGNRALIAEVDFTGQSKGYLTKMTDAEYAALPADIKKDYVLENGRYRFTEDRLKEVIAIFMEGLDEDEIDEGWITVGDKIYARLEDPTSATGSKIEFKNLVVKADPELGGRIEKDAQGNVINDRQFEQAAEFEIAYRVRGVQASYEAIKDEYGADAANKIDKLATNWYEFR